MSKEHDGMSPASLMVNIALYICKMQYAGFTLLRHSKEGA